MKNLSVPQILLLTFVPAILYLLSFILLTILLKDMLPPYLLCLIGIVLVMVPFQLGVILYTSKKEFGDYSLKSALKYTRKIPKLSFILSVIFSIVWAAVLFSVLQGFEHNFMFQTIFSFVPDYFKLGDFPNQRSLYSTTVLKITCVSGLILNGLVAPIVEELYFRGFMLPRISQFGRYSPLVITVLFSLYHLFSPWENITRIIAMYPYNHLVWKNKNIYIGIIAHCFVNLVGGVMTLLLIFSL